MFLNPAILIGLLAALIPIIIHYINFKKKRKIEFSSIQLLLKIEKTALKNFKIRQLILALIRAVVIFLIVLSFAKPFFDNNKKAPSRFASRVSVSTFLIIDATYSMEHKPEYAESQWIISKRAAIKFLESFNKQDELYLSITGKYDEITLPLSIEEAKNKILKAKLAPSHMPLESRIAVASQKLASVKNINREIIVISDFHPSGFYEVNEKVEFKDSKGLKIFLINVSSENKQNVAIRNTKIQTKIFEPGKPVKFKTNIRNFSTEKKKTKVKLFFNEKLVAQQVSTLPPNEEKSFILTTTTQETGFIRGKVKISNDPLPMDNSYYFSLLIPRKIKVLVGYNKPINAQFVKAALESFSDSSFFKMSFANEKDLDTKNFLNYDYIILSDILNITDNTSKRLNEFMQEQKGVLICLPPRISNYASYNKFLSSLDAGKIESGSIQKTTMLNVEIGSEILEGVFTNADASVKDKLLSSFLNVNEMVKYLSTEQEVDLVKTTSGYPLMVFSGKKGRNLMVISTVLNAKNTDLIFQPLFPAILFRSILFSASQLKQSQDVFLIGKKGNVRLPEIANLKTIKVFKPTGEFFIPKVKTVNQERRIVIEPNLFNEVGWFTVTAQDKTAMVISVNSNINESEILTVKEQNLVKSLEDKLNPQKIFYASIHRDIDKLFELLEGARKQASIWKLLLAVAFLLLVLETVLSRKTEA